MSLFHGDSLAVLRDLPPDSVDAVVTDPPYGLAFMGKKWDYDVPSVDLWREVLRVLKPGGHLLSFGGTRTYHRMVVAIEDAGFEIRDQIQWIYGSGFPKSMDVSKAIDKAAGAKRWQGWGTALKPANEPIVLARKPLSETTVAKNVLRWGTGCINIDGSRIAAGADLKPVHSGAKGAKQADYGSGTVFGSSDKYTSHVSTQGRWPSNCLFDEAAAAALDEMSGVLKTGGAGSHGDEMSQGATTFGGTRKARTTANSSGGASRFFQVIKQTEFDIPSAWQDPNHSDSATPAKSLTSPDENHLNSAREAVKTNFKNDPNLLHFLDSIPDSKKCFLYQDLASLVAESRSIGTTEIIQSLLKLSGSALHATDESINSENLASNKGPTRFLYQAKASKRERNAGLEGEVKEKQGARPNSADASGKFPDHDHRPSGGNNHPTVKPVRLMKYLCRLVTPPGGIILDPFMGSGSTGVAAKSLGFNFIGIEREAEYVEIARRRIEHSA